MNPSAALCANGCSSTRRLLTLLPDSDAGPRGIIDRLFFSARDLDNAPQRPFAGDMKTLRCWTLVAVALGTLVAGPARSADSVVELLTAVEAAKPDAPAEQPGLEPVATGPNAPQIIVEKPTTGGPTTAPFPVKIRFVPAAGAKINLDSLKIDVLKVVPISLLSRMKPYLTAVGIDLPEAKIPAGTYKVRIVVADDQGREGSSIQSWTIR